MASADIKAIRDEIETELRVREPLSTRELRRLLRKGGRRLSMRQVGTILKNEGWRRVQYVAGNSGSPGWVIDKWALEPEDVLPVIFFARHM